jgi:hypothetical protein
VPRCVWYFRSSFADRVSLNAEWLISIRRMNVTFSNRHSRIQKMQISFSESVPVQTIRAYGEQRSKRRRYSETGRRSEWRFSIAAMRRGRWEGRIFSKDCEEQFRAGFL